MLSTDRTDLFERLAHSDLVVDAHDGNEAGVLGDRIFQIVQIDETVLLNRKVGYFESALRQPAATVQNTFVFLGNEKQEKATVWVVITWFFFPL